VMFAASHNTPTPPGQERRARESAANGKLKIRVSARSESAASLRISQAHER